jgi:hypothetical protein
MITNAIITAISTPTRNAAGQVTLGTPTSCSVRCLLDAVRDQDIRQLGALLDGRVTAKLYLSMASGITPAKEQKLTVALDRGLGAKDYRMVYVDPFDKAGGLAHWEIFLQEIHP